MSPRNRYRAMALAALLLPLGACVQVPAYYGYGYGYPAYGPAPSNTATGAAAGAVAGGLLGAAVADRRDRGLGAAGGAAAGALIGGLIGNAADQQDAEEAAQDYGYGGYGYVPDTYGYGNVPAYPGPGYAY